jgi:hypothetical protein
MGILIRRQNPAPVRRRRTILAAAGAVLLLVFSGCNSNLLLDTIEREVSEATAPRVAELVVKKDGTIITNNDHYDFGHREVFNTASEQFSIKNEGNTALQLTGSELVAVSPTGATPANIFAVLQPSSPIPAGGTVNFFINFTPQDLTGYTGGIRIESNDPSLPVLEFTIAGSGTDDITPPQIISRSPAPFDADHPITGSIRIEFSEPLEPASLDTNNFAVTDVTGGGSTTVSGSRSFEAATNEAIFTPNGGSFIVDHEYHVELSENITDLSSNQLAPADWYFTAKSSDSSTTDMKATLSGLDLDTGQVTVYLIIYDQNGNPLENFSKYNFYIEEDSGSGFNHVGYNDLNIRSFAASSAPKSLSVIFDNTGSVQLSGFENEKNAHTDFFNSSSFKTEDAVALWQVYPPSLQSLLQNFTSDTVALEAALEAIIGPTGNSLIFDTTYHAITHHEEAGREGLEAVILSYDGGYTGTYNVNSVNSISNETNIPIFPFEFFPSNDPDTLELLSTAGWSYKSPTDFPGLGQTQYYDEYLLALGDAIKHMDKAHAITWPSTGVSGDTVDLRITVNYTGENGSWSVLDTDTYTLP